MRGAIVGLLVLLVLGYLGLKIGTAYIARRDLEQRLEHYLDVVDEQSLAAVKRDLIQDAGKLGIDLTPETIQIVYQDTKTLSLSQRLVGERIAQFTNKQVGISVHYVARILGFGWSQDITCDKIRQVAPPRAAPNPAYKQFAEPGE